MDKVNRNMFLLLSTGVQLYKQDNMGSVLPCGLTGNIISFS